MTTSAEFRAKRHWLNVALVGNPFWEMRGGKVLHAVVMSSIVAFALQLFDGPVAEFVDTTVQSTLLNQMAEPEYVPPKCTDPAGKGAANCISVVGIDDTDFRDVFKQQSPLNPAELQKLFERMQLNPPRVLAIDLDLSPASEEEMPAREKLRQSLLKLSKVTQVVMVCPQGYSTPIPADLDKQWVRGFGDNITFASADLGADGLYYNKHVTQNVPSQRDDLTIQTLGVVVAEALNTRQVKTSPKSNSFQSWHERCAKSSLAVTGVTGHIERELLRPTPVGAISFSQAIEKPESLTNRVVLLGGKWGINDRFTLRGQTDQFFGVTLHAWAVASEVAPIQKLAAPVTLILDVCIGLLSSFAFALIWKGVYTYKKSFALRSTFYLLFFLLAIFLPLAFITGAAHLAKVGLTLGVAGMILSAAADSILSSHEILLEHEEKENRTPPNFLAAMKSMWIRSLEKAKDIFLHPQPLSVVWFLLSLLSGWLFYAGQPGWAGTLVGTTFGIALGLADATTTQPGPEQEGVWDLVFRSFWLLIKVAAVAWSMVKIFHENGSAAPAMVCIFAIAWLAAFHIKKYAMEHKSIQT